MPDSEAKRGGHWGRIAFLDLGSEQIRYEGKYQGHVLDRPEFKKALELYYLISGFDSNGWPTEAKITELELNWPLPSR